MARLIANSNAASALAAPLRQFAGQAAWELRRGCGSFTRRYGPWGWCLACCVLVALLAWGGQRQQLARSASAQAELAQRLASLAHQPVTSQTGSVGKTDATSALARLQRFHQQLLAHEDLPCAVQALLDLGAAQGLLMQRGEYRPQSDSVGGFLRYKMSLPVKGEAAAIHRFVEAGLRQQPALLLDSVRFKRERIAASVIEARIDWVLLVRLPQGAPSSASPAALEAR